nr:MAG: hypothetical protein [Lokiarchaeota virus Skoll Meg22_1214]
MRFYKGKYQVEIIKKGKRKAMIRWTEDGEVGSQQLGYEERFQGDKDIAPIRLLWKRRRDIK